MSSEIDLTLLKTALRRRWWIVALCVLVPVALAVVVGLFQAQRYDAAVTLLVQSPRYQWRFEGAITAITDLRRDFQREILAIARSDEVAQGAAQALQAGGMEETITAEALQSAIMVRAGDGNTIIVTASAADPERASTYARAWTEQLVASARDVYGAVQDLASFQAELEILETQLQQKEDALAQIRARTGIYSTADLSEANTQSNVTMQHLNQLNAMLAEYQVALESLRYVQAQMAAAEPGADLAQLPWELLDAPALLQRGVLSSQIARATLGQQANLENLLRQEETALQATAGELARQAEQSRATLAADWQAVELATRERNQARDTYQILLRKVNELSLQEQVDPSLLTVVGSGEPVVSNVRTSLIGLLATAAVAGLVVGVLLAVWLELRARQRADVHAADHTQLTSY